jgi:tetratricopeptide (TPR) repeat protein
MICYVGTALSGVQPTDLASDQAILMEAGTAMVQFSAAGYDVPVAGIDEANARSVLGAMQDRLARDPASALGLAGNATADDVRAAFLQLTKQYHPVRFGRMALDIQRLSNEVFLALRAAHDALVKAARARRLSGPIPIVRGSAPAGAGPPPSAPSPVRKSPASRPSGQQPVVRPPSPVRQTGGYPVVISRDEAVAHDLLQRQQWDQARSVLHQLLARDPSSKRIRALMCYARGREAQLDRRVDDARVELQDALDLDPDLQLAKTALTELFTRRK